MSDRLTRAIWGRSTCLFNIGIEIKAFSARSLSPLMRFACHLWNLVGSGAPDFIFPVDSYLSLSCMRWAYDNLLRSTHPGKPAMANLPWPTSCSHLTTQDNVASWPRQVGRGELTAGNCGTRVILISKN